MDSSRGDYVSVPTTTTNGSSHSRLHSLSTAAPPVSRRPRHANGANGGACRPRTIGTVLLICIGTVLLLPTSNRQSARTAITKSGVPIPDRLHDWLDNWAQGTSYNNGGAGAPGFTPVTSGLGGDPDMDYWDDATDGNAPSGATADSDDMTIDPAVDGPYELASNGHLVMKALDEYQTAPKPHPILTLIRKAERKWKRKVARQSKTLKEAAEEYRRRYKRNPPKGFDEWWKYAKQNQIVLTDEYDQIWHDIEPFWALEPQDFKHRSMVMQQRAETFTIRINKGKVEVHGEQAFLRRAKDLADLIGRFSEHVPDINMTFTRHDQPAVRLGYAARERMVELARLGDHIGPSDFVADTELPLSNWADACSGDSPLRRLEVSAIEAHKEEWKPEFNYTIDKHGGRSFVWDYQKGMDICQHPEIMPLHGFTTAVGTNAGPLVPLFTFAKTNIHSDLLVTPLEQYSDTYIGYDPDWDKKPYNELMWRGSTTGADFLETTDWQNSQRARLHFKTNEMEGAERVLLAEGDAAVDEVEYPISQLNDNYMDVSFAGSPVQCDKATCAIMEEVIDFQPLMGLDESYQYKYVMDVDGNGWSGRFHRLITMKACTLKSTIFPEWYGDRIQPWVHYVPVKVDYSDLYDIMTFFRGSPDGKGGHDDLAKKIATQGKEWARDHWRKQDMASYMMRLCLEWARLFNRDSNAVTDYLD